MRRIIAFGFPALALLATAAAAQSYPPPPQPYDPGPGAYNNDQPPYDDQGDDQGPYYDPQPDGSYQDQQPYDQGYPDQAYPDQGSPDQGAYGNQGPVDESVFYSELAPYGRWIQRGSYGWVWEPTRVGVDWRPYTQGHWVDTDYGWTWVSDEPWGWATYHYGRWLLDREYGWLWVPGTEWGPAWVSFQQGGGYLGWAPLPPSVGFRAGIGIQIGGLSIGAEIDPYAYSFVPERSFLNERIATEILPPARNVTFVRQTRNITNIREENHRIVNRSVPVEHIQQVTGHPVRQYRLTDVRSPAQGRVARVQGDQVTIFRPAPRLAQPRPNVTPQAVIQQRRQRQAGQQQPPTIRPGQRAPQPGQVAPGAGGAGDMQPRPGQQAQRPSRQPVLSGAELDRKYSNEQQQLQARQQAQRSRLQQMHDQERGDQAAAQHQAEQRALQEQQQREQQMLQARHQREQQAAQARPQRQSPPPQQSQPRETQQRRQREQQRAEEDRRKQQPPPPPPV